MLCIFLVFFSILLALLLYLFFAPFYIEVNSNTGILRLRMPHLASVSLHIEDGIYIEAKLPGCTRRWVPGFYEKKNELHKTGKPVKQNKGALTGISPARLKALAGSFKINTCTISIDTGDMPWNGMLYPAFYWLSWYSGKRIAINFTGKNEIVLEIQNSLARMSRAFISST